VIPKEIPKTLKKKIVSTRIIFLTEERAQIEGNLQKAACPMQQAQC
jgi:hypothetical protein